MAEGSIFWTTGATGDGATTYTQAQLNAWLRRTFVNATASEGVIYGYANQLAVSGSASPLAVATGAAMVYGFPYENDSSLNLAVTTPSVGTTGGHVILRVNWTAQTVRAFAVRNTDGVAAIPSLTQTASTTWEIRLATFTITTGGAITLTDARAYLHFGTRVSVGMLDDLAGLSVVGRSANTTGVQAAITAGSDGYVLRRSGTSLGFGQVATAGLAADSVDDTIVGNRVPAIIRRQGGSASNWSTGGGTNQTLTTVRMQIGVATVLSATLGAPSTITFNVAFSNAPIIFAVDMASTGCVMQVTSIGASSFAVRARDVAGADTNTTVAWMAIGPE